MRGVEVARLGPQPRAGRADPVAPLGHPLAADGDLLVPAFDQPVAFEPGHQLVEGGRGAPAAVRGQRLAHQPSRLLAVAKQTEHEELQVGEARESCLLHNATLSTVGLDGGGAPEVYPERARVFVPPSGPEFAT